VSRYEWTTDTRMLAAGNTRGLVGGDAAALPVSPPGPCSARGIDDGQRVCVRGRGVRGDQHQHGAVERVTRTSLCVRTDDGDQLWFSRGDGTVIPQSPHSRTWVSARCATARKAAR
jgi:hypothetical protein